MSHICTCTFPCGGTECGPNTVESSIKELEAALGDMLPPWAIGPAHGQLVVGAQLPTRDGRRCGNAHIIEVVDGYLGMNRLVYTVLTDAGSRMRLTASEADELFHPPRYVCELSDVLRKFDRDLSEGV